MVTVPDHERQRRPQRDAVPQAREHLDLVQLELLAWAATVALSAAVKIVRDRALVEAEAGGEPGDDRDESGAV
jgi:hypothetical protein